jgi:hypothetical protein
MARLAQASEEVGAGKIPAAVGGWRHGGIAPTLEVPPVVALEEVEWLEAGGYFPGTVNSIGKPPSLAV